VLTCIFVAASRVVVILVGLVMAWTLVYLIFRQLATWLAVPAPEDACGCH